MLLQIFALKNFLEERKRHVDAEEVFRKTKMADDSGSFNVIGCTSDVSYEDICIGGT